MYATCVCMYSLVHVQYRKLMWLQQNSIPCADINECETGISECDQTCYNNNGSYTCSCDTGFTLNSDGLHCDGN